MTLNCHWFFFYTIPHPFISWIIKILRHRSFPRVLPSMLTLFLLLTAKLHRWTHALVCVSFIVANSFCPSHLGPIIKCIARNWIHNESVYFPYDYLPYVINVPNPLCSLITSTLLLHCQLNIFSCFRRREKEARKLLTDPNSKEIIFFTKKVLAIILAVFITYIKYYTDWSLPEKIMIQLHL